MERKRTKIEKSNSKICKLRDYVTDKTSNIIGDKASVDENYMSYLSYTASKDKIMRYLNVLVEEYKK